MCLSMPTYWEKYTSRNKENGQMIKKDIRQNAEKGVVIYRGKGMYFWQCTSKWVALDIKRTAKTKQIQRNFRYLRQPK